MPRKWHWKPDLAIMWLLLMELFCSLHHFATGSYIIYIYSQTYWSLSMFESGSVSR